MKKNHEVVGLVIDAIQQNDTLRFLSAITGCTIKDFDKITYNGSRTVGDYLSILPIFQMMYFRCRQCWNWQVWKQKRIIELKN